MSIMSIPKSVAVIIPAYNEEEHLARVIQRTAMFVPREQIIIIDDGSSDTTRAIALQAGVRVLSHLINMGKGAAANTGCMYAFQNGFDRVVLMDSDGQHEPEDIIRFLDALQNRDIVFGYRKNGSSPFIQRLGNIGLTMISKLLFSMPIIDTQSGFRAFTKKAYAQIKWKATGYEMESEMIAHATGLRYTQIPIKLIYLDNVKGTTIMHGLKIAFAMLRWKLGLK